MTPRTSTKILFAGIAIGLVLSVSRKTMRDLGLATYEQAKRDLDLGIQEEGGHNLGPAIERYAEPFGLTPPLNWCALAVSAWIRAAATIEGLTAPVDGHAAAKGLMAQFQLARKWIDVSRIHDKEHLRRGNVLVWHRGEPDAWTGHVGVIAEHEPGSEMIYTIEGNSGPVSDRVARMARSRHDPRLLGVGILRSKEAGYATDIADTMTPFQLDEISRLMNLSHEIYSATARDPMDEVDAMLETIAENERNV